MAVNPPDPGGGTPGTGIIVFMHEGENLLGGSALANVVEIGATTVPSNIYFQTRIPLPPPPPLPAGQLRAEAQSVVDVLSGAIEDSLIGPYIDTMAYVNDYDRAGRMVDEMEVFWSSPDGRAQGSIIMNLQRVEPGLVNPAVQAAVAPFL